MKKLILMILLSLFFLSVSTKRAGAENELQNENTGVAVRIKNFSDLRRFIVRTQVNNFDEANESQTIAELNPNTNLNSSVGIDAAVKFYSDLNGRIRNKCFDNEWKEITRTIFVPKIQSFLNSLSIMANDSTMLSDAEQEQHIYAEIKDVLGINQKKISRINWLIVWYRMQTAEYSIGCDTENDFYDKEAGLTKAQATRTRYAAKVIYGVNDPKFCIAKVKETSLLQSGIYWDEEVPWIAQEYDISLKEKSNHIRMINGEKAYYLFLEQYFPYGNGSVSDWITPTVQRIIHSKFLSLNEKQRIVKKINSRLLEFNKVIKKQGKSTESYQTYEIPRK